MTENGILNFSFLQPKICTKCTSYGGLLRTGMDDLTVYPGLAHTVGPAAWGFIHPVVPPHPPSHPAVANRIRRARWICGTRRVLNVSVS